MKRYSVCYSIEQQSEAIVKATSKKDAAKKVQEVLGADIHIKNIWELAKEKK